MVPGAPTGIGSQASRHLTQEHATLIGTNEQENPEEAYQNSFFS